MRDLVWERSEGRWFLYDRDKGGEARAHIAHTRGYSVKILTDNPFIENGIWETVAKFPPDTPIETVKRAAMNFCLLGMDTGT